MKKIITLILVLTTMSMLLTACQTNVENEHKNETKPTENITEDTKVNEETIPSLSDLPFNFEYFEPTGKVYETDSLIDKFPLLNDEDDFWNQVNFAVHPTDDCQLNILSEYPTYLKWNDLKNVTIDNVNMFILGGNETVLPSIDVKFLTEDMSKTLYDIIKNREWYGNCYLDEEKHMDLFFPIKANSIAKMIVANYGQPSEAEVDEFNGVYEIKYNVINRSVTMKIGKNTSPNNYELPYQIQLFIGIYEP